MLCTIVGRKWMWLKLASTVADTQKTANKTTYKYANRKGKTRVNTGPLLIEGGNLTNRNVDKVEMFNVFFTCLQH